MKKLFINIVVGCLILSACDTLEQTPVSIISEANFYKSRADAEAAIIGVYDGIQGYSGNNMILPPNIMSDDSDAISGGNYTRTETFAVTPTDGHVGDTWRALYIAVGRANDVLDNVPRISDPNFTETDRNRIIGEAYFLRGLLYFNLVRRYGKVPLVTEAFKSPNQNYQPQRDEKSTVYNQIILDLEEAKKLLPANVTNKARASKWAAAGILAKVYLDRNEAGDKEKALTELNGILGSNTYSLVPADQYHTLFASKAQNTSETIFEISYRPTGVEDGALDNEFVPKQRFRVHPSVKIISALKADSAIVVESEKSEVRMAAALARHNINSRGYYINKFSKDDWTVQTNRTNPHPNIIVLRLADVILLKAELENENNNTSGAITLLNQIRNRVNLPNTTATTKDEVRMAIEDERFKELAFEGHRFYDLIRTGRALEVINNKGTKPTAQRLIWPIPQSDIDQNPNLLPQNDSY